MLSPKAKESRRHQRAAAPRRSDRGQAGSARCGASVAVHGTVVVPTLKVDPDGGVQLVVTGGLPLTKVGAGKGTAMALPLVS